MIAQILKEMLSVLSLTQGIFAEDQVEPPLQQFANCSRRAGCGLDILDSTLAKHAAQRPAHIGAAINDQCTDGIPLSHGKSSDVVMLSFPGNDSITAEWADSLGERGQPQARTVRIRLAWRAPLGAGGCATRATASRRPVRARW
ncbi:MAG: hypothetical protein MOGDAGHF_02067 [Rhodocyclaceae bacterium]|nr:hypothetical protein [Rhodocyclaceae bacterium]